MRQKRLLACGLLGAVAALAACSSERVTSPLDGAPPPTLMRSGGGPTCEADVVRDIIKLFRPVEGAIELAKYLVALDAYEDAKTKTDTVNAQSLMLAAQDFALKRYNAGALIGGISSTTQSLLIDLFQDQDCQVGIDGSALNPAALLPGNFLGVVPSTTTTTVIAGDNTAGVNVTGTTSSTTVQIINTTPTNCVVGAVTYPGPLCTDLDQYPGAHLISFVPEPTGSPTFYTSECINTASLPPGVDGSSFHLAHNVPVDPTNPSGAQQVEVLPYAPAANAPVLPNCGGAIHTASSAPFSTLFRLARAGDVRGAASQIGSMMASALYVDAYAGGTGSSITVSGTHHSGSPFVPVDTTVFIVATSPTSGQIGAIGSMATPPAVKVQTHGTLTAGPTPLPGVTVAFSGPPGSTQLTGTGCPTGCATVTTTTDVNGAASVATWTLVVGLNTVNAVGTYPLQTGPAPLGPHGIVTVSGNPVAFSATGTGNVIMYDDVGYATHLGDVTTPVAPAGFITDGSWLTSQSASFGSDIGGTYCPLDPTIKSLWNNANPPTFFLIQKTFTLPPGYQGDLKVGVAIDNDAQVFVNGVDVTAGGVLGTYGGPLNYDGQFLEHEGCATNDSFFIPATQAVTHLQAGTNVISVRARDRGVTSYVDVRLSTP